MDLVSYGQGVVFLNGLNYKPRPVFQSYSAYTPTLLEMNQRQLDRYHESLWVMLNLSSIDNRLPTLDDGMYLSSLLANHDAIAEEGGFLLFKPSTEKITEGSRLVMDHAGSLGEWISVPAPKGETLTTVMLDISLGVKGKLFQLLLRGPGVLIETETVTGDIERYRLAPEMTKTPFIISPLPRNNMDIVDTLSGSAGNRHIKQFRIITETRLDDWLVRPVFKYGFSTTPYRPVPPNRRTEMLGMRSAGFSHIPSAISGRAELKNDQGTLVMGAHAPSAFVFDLPAGKYAMKGRVGILRDALTVPLCAASESDGIELEIEISEPQNITILRKTVNPFKSNSDRGPQTFSIDEFVLNKPSKVIVRINAGPNGSPNTACDWSYLEGIQIISLL